MSQTYQITNRPRRNLPVSLIFPPQLHEVERSRVISLFPWTRQRTVKRMKKILSTLLNSVFRHNRSAIHICYSHLISDSCLHLSETHNVFMLSVCVGWIPSSCTCTRRTRPSCHCRWRIEQSHPRWIRQSHRGCPSGTFKRAEVGICSRGLRAHNSAQ